MTFILENLGGRLYKAIFMQSPLFSSPNTNILSSVQVRNTPDSGKCLANSKGVHYEMESEGSWRQTSGLTHRNLI